MTGEMEEKMLKLIEEQEHMIEIQAKAIQNLTLILRMSSAEHEEV